MREHLDSAQIDSFDLLEGEERTALLQHARDCSGCRARLIEAEPGRLFALLATEPLPESALDCLSERLEVKLDDAPPEVRTARNWYALAAVAASVLLAVLIGFQLSRQSPQGTEGEPPLAGLTTEENSDLPQFEGVDAGSPELLRSIELISSPGEGQLVDFAIGEVQVVMIIDREMDI